MRKVLIELYSRINTGVIIWLTNITGKKDCVCFYLPFPLLSTPGSIVIGPSSLFPRNIQIDIISMYFIFARFDLVRSFFYIFFSFVTDRQLNTELPHFLISNDVRLPKSLQICLHYVLTIRDI